MRDLSSLSPRLALAAGVLSISWGSILARLCVSGPLGIAFWRMALSAAIVAPLAALSRRSARRTGRTSRDREVLPLLVLSGAFLALHFATWMASLRYTSVGASVLLVSTQPLFGVALARLFLGETASGRTVLAVIVTLAGTLVIAWGDLGAGPGALVGDSLALAGAAFAAGYLLIGRGVRSRIEFGPYLFSVYAVAAVALGALAFSSGRSGRFDLSRDGLWFLLMAAGPGVAGHGLLNWSVRRMRAYVVNAAVLGEPILATLLAWMFFGESPRGTLYAGGALVVAGLVWILHEEGRRPPDPSGI